MTSPRIVVLTTYYHPVLGGVETHARQLAQCLSRRCLHVTIVTKRTDRSSPRRDHVDGIPVYRFRPLGPRTPSAKWLFLPSAFWALLRLRRRFDVIYCPDPRALGIAAVLAGKLLRRPVVVAAATPGALSCANWDQTLVRWRIASGGRLAAAIKWSARRLYAAADRFVCISRQIEQEARSCGIAQHRLVYLPYFVDLTRFRGACPDEVARTRVELGWRSDQLVCLFIGRLSQEKGVLELLHAWRDLNPRAAILALVGPDMPGHPLDAGAAARRFVATHGMQDRVLFQGPSTEPERLLQAADLFVHPSHYEAFGLSIIEAMASGLPIVASKVGGILDYLVDGENALLCTPGAVDDLGEQIRRLLAEPDLRKRLAQAARTTAEQSFDVGRIGDRFVELFHQMAAGPVAR